MRKIKFLIFALIIMMTINAPISVLAATSSSADSNSFDFINLEGEKEVITILQDDENVRIAKSEKEDGSWEIVTFDKKSNVLTQESSEKSTEIIDLGKQMKAFEEQQKELVREQKLINDEIGIMATGDSYQHTWLNYEYDIWRYSTGDKWKVTKPVGSSLTKTTSKDRTRTTSNKGKLDEYRNYVEDINSWEAGTGALLIITGGLALIASTVATAGVATGAIWAALGFVAADVGALSTIDALCNKADIVYSNI